MWVEKFAPTAFAIARISLYRFCNDQSAACDPMRKFRSLLYINLVDILVICGFAFFAFLCYLGRWNGADDFVFLSSDAANIASFAAAWDYPGFFYGDEILGNQDNFRSYLTVHIPIIRFLAKMTHDYGNAFILLLGPHIFLQAVGFYIFGRVVLKDRYWAVLLAIITLMPLRLNLGTYWGIFLDPLPRSSFQSLLPYLLAGAFYWRTTPKVWPWLMGTAGVLIYVHPVSAPEWGFAIWSGMWLFLPNSWSYPKRLAYMLFLGILFLAVTSPFLIYYLPNHAHGPTLNYELVYDIMKMRFSKGFLDIPEAIKDFIWEIRYVLILAIIGVAITFRLHQKDRKSLNLILIWILSLLVISVCVPLVEQKIAVALEHIPVEMDLIRGMRYTIPLLMLFWLWPLVEMNRKTGSRLAVRIVGLILTLGWVYNQRGWENWQNPNTAPLALKNWVEGYFVREQEEHLALRETLNTLSQLTPQGSRILPLSPLDPFYAFSLLQVRYSSLRPIVYSFKDGGTLAYANHEQLIEWYEKVGVYIEIYELAQEKISEKDYDSVLNLYIDLAQKWDAQYLLIKLNIDPISRTSLLTDVLYADHGYLIIKVPDRQI